MCSIPSSKHSWSTPSPPPFLFCQNHQTIAICRNLQPPPTATSHSPNSLDPYKWNNLPSLTPENPFLDYLFSWWYPQHNHRWSFSDESMLFSGEPNLFYGKPPSMFMIEKYDESLALVWSPSDSISNETLPTRFSTKPTFKKYASRVSFKAPF